MNKAIFIYQNIDPSYTCWQCDSTGFTRCWFSQRVCKCQTTSKFAETFRELFKKEASEHE